MVGAEWAKALPMTEKGEGEGSGEGSEGSPKYPAPKNPAAKDSVTSGEGEADLEADGERATVSPQSSGAVRMAWASASSRSEQETARYLREE